MVGPCLSYSSESSECPPSVEWDISYDKGGAPSKIKTGWTWDIVPTSSICSGTWSYIPIWTQRRVTGPKISQPVPQSDLIIWFLATLGPVPNCRILLFLAAIAALCRTMSVGLLVGLSVCHQRVSKLVIILQDNSTMHRIQWIKYNVYDTMHRMQCIE